jgi:hypothetical protein
VNVNGLPARAALRPRFSRVLVTNSRHNADFSHAPKCPSGNVGTAWMIAQILSE